MDPYSELKLWYVYKLTAQAGSAQLLRRALELGRRMRRVSARWGGYAALRVGKWLLAEARRASVEPGPETQQPTWASRSQGG
jgi:hypothetical protein